MTDSFKTLFAGVLAAMVVFTSAAVQAEAEAEQDSKAVAERVEALKKNVIRLNRDLFILEEDLLFPASTQFAVFLSVNAGEFLNLDAVKLKVDGDIVASHLYTERQVTALERGGMQRLFIGNLKTGTHEVTVFVEGMGPNNRAYKQAATLAFEKSTETTALEIRIKDRSSDYQPMVSIVEWE
ncbi:AraC family transcriptional regulator [Marinobacter maritimus]|uniref:AraC family transcriptional regulator n=1 Tax=Marinobacter maritimus TaxID=277961 RepID=UPI001FE8FF78|nr:AraC family transcriptional regulator [Marinobacter maritimus]